MTYRHQLDPVIKNADFKRLFDSSRPFFDPDIDQLNPQFFLGAQGYDQKLAASRSALNHFLSLKNGFCFQIFKDDYLVMFYAGELVDDMALAYITLQGPDLSGKLLWTQESGAYHAVRDYYSQDNPLNLKGFIVHTNMQGSFYNLITANFDRYLEVQGQAAEPVASVAHYLDAQGTPVAFDYPYQEITWKFR
jgi:hypothetical protein